MAQEPVLTDKTGQQILKELRENRASTKECLEKLGQSIGGVPEIFMVQATITYNDNGVASGLVLATDLGDIKTAYFDEKLIILHAYDETLKKSYFAPLTSVDDWEADRTTLRFDSIGNNTPMGRPMGYQILQIKSANYFSVSFAPQAINARYISCQVTIGTTQCDTLEDALSVIAAAI